MSDLSTLSSLSGGSIHSPSNRSDYGSTRTGFSRGTNISRPSSPLPTERTPQKFVETSQHFGSSWSTAGTDNIFSRTDSTTRNVFSSQQESYGDHEAMDTGELNNTFETMSIGSFKSSRSTGLFII